MKKLLTILFALGVIALAYQLVVNLFISHRETTYSLLSNNHSFEVNEKFHKSSGKHYYEYVVEDEKKNAFSFFIINDFNKQTKVLKDIVTYEDKKMTCYLPIYKDGSTSEINCIVGKGKNKELVDYNYLVMSGADTDALVKFYEHLNYSRDSWNKGKDTKKKYSINNNSIAYVYSDNVTDNYVFPIWNYSGLFLINKDDSKTMQYLDNDIYENKYSVLVGKYYFIFDLVNKSDNINDLYYVNVEDGGKATMMIPGGLSGNVVINGEYKNKLYITDLEAKKQFCIDPFLNKIEVVGNEDDGFYTVKDNKLVKMESREFIKNTPYFNTIVNEEISNKFGNVSIKKTDDVYYFKTDNNDFYRVIGDSVDSAVKLFHFDNVSEWESKTHGIMVVRGDTMYFYDENNGLRPILQNKELTYNFKNICNYYKKS